MPSITTYRSLHHSLFLLLALCLPLSLAAEELATKESTTKETTDIKLVSGWVRETPPGAQNAAAFLTLANDSANAKNIVDVQCTNVAAHCEIHEHLHNANGGMRMQKINAPLTVPANGTLPFVPGGYHVMMLDLLAPLRAGSKATLVFVFDDNSTLTVQLPVTPVSAE